MGFPDVSYQWIIYHLCSFHFPACISCHSPAATMDGFPLFSERNPESSPGLPASWLLFQLTSLLHLSEHSIHRGHALFFRNIVSITGPLHMMVPRPGPLSPEPTLLPHLGLCSNSISLVSSPPPSASPFPYYCLSPQPELKLVFSSLLYP